MRGTVMVTVVIVRMMITLRLDSTWAINFWFNRWRERRGRGRGLGWFFIRSSYSFTTGDTWFISGWGKGKAGVKHREEELNNNIHVFIYTEGITTNRWLIASHHTIGGNGSRVGKVAVSIGHWYCLSVYRGCLQCRSGWRRWGCRVCCTVCVK